MKNVSDSPAASRRLSLVLERLFRSLRTRSTAGGISASAAGVLGRLETDGPAGITQLARAENVSQPAITQLVTRMEADGLVERRASKTDRRGVTVSITARGREVAEERRRTRAQFLGELVDDIDDDDRVAIVAALPALERLAERARQSTVILSEEDAVR